MTVDNGANNVLSLLATVVDLYREAASLLDHRKAQCAQQRAPPPSRVLEESIDQAPEEIEKEKKRCLTRFGDRFELGDHDAISELRQIVVQLQGELLDRLSEIADGEGEVDYAPLSDAADIGRDAAIMTVLNLKQRLMEAESRKKSSASNTQRGRVSGQSRQSHEIGREYTAQEQTSGGTDSVQDQPRRSHSGSLFGLFKHHRGRNGSDEGDLGRQRSFKRLSIHSSSATPPSASQENQRGNLKGERAGDDPLNRQGSGTSVSHEVHQVPGSSISSTDSSDKSSTASTARLHSISSISASLGGPASATAQPNSDNDYLGFCKGAARLQTGDRQAMQRTKEFNDGWSSSKVYYLSCCNVKCAFASHLDLDSIWTKVWLLEEIGVKFRWPFLAKSHIAQTAKAKQSEYAYRCLFCVFLGLKAPVIDGTDSYLEHVSDIHRGDTLGDVVLYRTSCIAGRVCDDGEDFDINLFPLTDEECVQRREAKEVLPDEAIDGTDGSGAGPLEPVETTTPWCDDMPDFHPTDTLEAIERQYSLRSFRSQDQS